MATTLFMRDTAAQVHTGNKDLNLLGVASYYQNMLLSTTRGPGFTSLTQNTVAGPTAGIEVQNTAFTWPIYRWISLALDADVTISGSITWNLRASETNMSANVAINGRLEKLDGATGVVTLIDQTARTAEVAVTTDGANNFAEAPGAGVLCKKGDRLIVRVFGDDAGTMATGYTFTFTYDGATVAAQGDSYLTLTEDLTFITATPAGSTIYPTNTASAVATASVDREAWTSRGAGVQTDVTNTVAGPTAPIQVTDTAGGTVVDWFTRPLAAFTLGGAVTCNLRGGTSVDVVNFRVEVAVVNNDGSSPVAWAFAGGSINSWGGAEAAVSYLISGPDVAVTEGQRLRIRLFIDDWRGGDMASGTTATLWYAGTTLNASGDTWLIFTQTLTESSGAPAATPFNRNKRLPQQLAH